MSADRQPQKFSRSWIFLAARWAAALLILGILFYPLPVAPLRSALARAPLTRFIAVLLIYVEMRGSETVLIAEDHESIREMARQIPLNLRYRVLWAGDGEEALRLCEKETSSLAILDLVMPKQGGVAVASKLTALFAGLPILFTSGYSPDSENRSPVIAGARYLQKPTAPRQLAAWCGKFSTKRKSEVDRAEPGAQNGNERAPRPFTIPCEAEKGRVFPIDPFHFYR